MEALPTEPKTWNTLPQALRDSWLRSAGGVRDPISALPPIDLDDAALREYRKHHPLRLVLPVLRRLLIEPAAEAGLIVAIGDAAGRLLWVEGARETLRQAERSAFQPGANWSESAIGTSAPGLALATGRGAQVHREQHFSYTAHRFSCSAVPVRDPGTGRLIGVVDLTGDAQAVAVHSLPLLLAAVSAAEAELKLRPASIEQITVSTLGASPAELVSSDTRQPLGLRHAEILLLLGWQAARGSQRGLGAEELSHLLYGESGHEVAVRAELVRLRRLLTKHHAPGIDLLSRPYRLSAPVLLDAAQAHAALFSGDRRAALDLYQGELLPGSEAPGVLRIRRELSALLREAVLADGSTDDLWRYLQLPEALTDQAAIRTALRTMPPDSPHRAVLVARTES